VKRCSRCGAAKPTGDFYVNRCWADGRHPYCKECLLAYQRESRRERLDRGDPGRRRWSRDFVRHDYFGRIDKPARAYVAGLLAADGNVLERQRRVTVELASRDRELVRFARDEVAPGFPIRERVRANGVKTTLLAVTSAQLCADLSRLGITPRKSLTLRWPQGLSGASARLFLLGYFDGDGFIIQSRNGPYVYSRWGLLGTASFLSGALSLICEETGISPRRIRRHGERKVHAVHINGVDAFLVDEWLHAGTDLGLARKQLDRLERCQTDSAASSSSLL
jgi:LAGLIDADG-like domain